MSWWKNLFGKAADAPEDPAKGAPVLDLQPTGTAATLPVWVDVAPDAATNVHYNGLLWEVEPYGEYLYFLAGDFPNTDRGLLRYASAPTLAEVQVSFEADQIALDRSEMARFHHLARTNGTLSSVVAGMTVGEIARAFGVQTGALALIEDADLGGGIGYVELTDFFLETPWVRIMWSTYVETPWGPRMTKVIVRSTDPDQPIDPMLDLFASLVDRYRDIAVHELSGAIRM